jgi:Family of unknown function (DUF6356)
MTGMANHMRTTFERLFVTHPRSVDEGYLAHAGVALRFAMLLVLAGLAAAVHALIPALFETRASSIVKKLHAEMLERAGTSQRTGNSVVG